MSRRVAIVSGGGTGIGRAVCLRLAREGFAVAVACSRSVADAESTLQALRASGGEGEMFQADIADESSVQSLFAAVKARFGRIDVVVNNAGIGHSKKLAQIEMAEFDHIFGVNARGTFMMCREAAQFIEDGGRIVNVSTGATKGNPARMALYVGSKLAVEGFTKVLARELALRGITVNAVSPGMTDTPMLLGGDAEALRAYGAQAAAMRRVGQPEDVADAIAALVSADGRWITGQNIAVDGGTNIV
ncbi:MAG: SDR family oxidoreductase [Proteobacteria bacterium]|nr:SDR family oxidoreductase [Pseudomonadota bacterium]HQR03478.1 SDR family oxidoreductase [Rhodocyclaceae bacterium]